MLLPWCFALPECKSIRSGGQDARSSLTEIKTGLSKLNASVLEIFDVNRIFRCVNRSLFMNLGNSLASHISIYL